MLCGDDPGGGSGGATNGHGGIGPNSINPIECVRVLSLGVNTITTKKIYMLYDNIMYIMYAIGIGTSYYSYYRCTLHIHSI